MRDLDDVGELRVALVLEADIAGIDAVFVERLGAGRIIGQQLVADVMEVADQRRGDAALAQAVADVRHGGGGFLAVDGDAHQFRAGARQRRDLRDRALDIGGVGVGHRLHHDRRAAADGDIADHDLGGVMPGAGAAMSCPAVSGLFIGVSMADDQASVGAELRALFEWPLVRIPNPGSVGEHFSQWINPPGREIGRESGRTWPRLRPVDQIKPGDHQQRRGPEGRASGGRA